MSARLAPPATLRAEIARSLAPVRPLAPPWRRALSLAPLAALFLVGIPLHFGLRGDAERLGPLLAWGSS